MGILEKLESCVVAGKKDEIEALVKTALNDGLSQFEIIQNGMRKGLEAVGEGFEKMEIFLPEMIQSADAMTQGIEILKESLVGEDQVEEIGRVVIGTVNGDIHDIGKNIVSTFLSISGFTVYDLGLSVSVEKFLDKAEEKNADIICLSALLTTTMPAMKDFFKEMEYRGIRDKYKILVGGGPVTKEWADTIGADGYGEDFVEAVRVCKELV